MPITLMHLVALVLAATVTLCIAPMALWRGREQPGDRTSESPFQVRDAQAVHALHLPQDRLS